MGSSSWLWRAAPKPSSASPLDTGDRRHFFSGSTNYKIEADAEQVMFLAGMEQVFQGMGITPADIRGMVMGMSG